MAVLYRSSALPSDMTQLPVGVMCWVLLLPSWLTVPPCCQCSLHPNACLAFKATLPLYSSVPKQAGASPLYSMAACNH